MKRTLFDLLLASLPAGAQLLHEYHTSAFGGVGFSEPLNPVARGLDTGWNVTGGVGVTGQYLGLMLDGMYNEFGLADSFARTGSRDAKQRFWAVTLDPVVHLNERGPIDFYVTAGGGIYNESFNFNGRFGAFGRDSFRNSNSIYKGGVDGGAGFAFKIGLSRLRIFAEARYHHMFTTGSGASFVPVTVGLRW